MFARAHIRYSENVKDILETAAGIADKKSTHTDKHTNVQSDIHTDTNTLHNYTYVRVVCDRVGASAKRHADVITEEKQIEGAYLPHGLTSEQQHRHTRTHSHSTRHAIQMLVVTHRLTHALPHTTLAPRRSLSFANTELKTSTTRYPLPNRTHHHDLPLFSSPLDFTSIHSPHSQFDNFPLYLLSFTSHEFAVQFTSPSPIS